MPDFVHKPVMMVEVLAAMRPQAGGCYADGTVGGAGHAAAILAASSPTGWLFGCDRDGAAVEAAQARLAEFAGRFEIRRGNHAELAEWVPAGSCDAVLLDLGVSSAQLDRPERGFSFQQDGPLDMRMDTRQPQTAAELVNTMPETELADLIRRVALRPGIENVAAHDPRPDAEVAITDCVGESRQSLVAVLPAVTLSR